MKTAWGLLLPLCLVIAMSREMTAEQQRSSDGTAGVRGDNQFAIDLYAQLDRTQPGENLFFSPTSVSLALSMTAAGARGPTLSEMVKVLHLAQDLSQAQAHDRQLLEEWNAVGQKRAYQLRVANRLWGQKGYPIRPEFLALTREQYGAEMSLLDFAQAESARAEINQWVEQQTNGKIKDLIASGMIGAFTRLVLTNAVYFQGDWVKPFDKKNTRDEDFTVSASRKIKVPLMHQKAMLGYADEETFQALEMPYAGSELSMVVLLPKQADGLPELEKSLSVEKLAELTTKLGAREIVSYLPRFKMATAFRLNPVLEALGMRRAFSREADFSGISAAEDLCVSDVLHKAYVDVNEEGTEAAAATAVVMKAMAVRRAASIPMFRADHPFLFLIRDMRSGSILFLGRLTNPSA
jgi:serpin B